MIIKSYLGDNKSYLGDNKSCVRDSESYVGDKKIPLIQFGTSTLPYYSMRQSFWVEQGFYSIVLTVASNVAIPSKKMSCVRNILDSPLNQNYCANQGPHPQTSHIS